MDAVDQFATVMLIESDESGARAALNGASWFFIQGSKVKKLKQLAFWDEHRLGQQRFYNIACLVYGKSPGQHADFITLGYLPEERAERCEDEYKKTSNSWNNLLTPYLKDQENN